MNTANAPPPLAELVVLDLSRVLAGPYACMMLADLGAEVIKVERPGSGDDTRQWGPPWAGGESAYYLSVNRNKKSITLDLKTEEARDIVRELACRADVLVENWRPGTMEKWGLGYDDICQKNPGLIYCSISGYGQTGPQRSRPGYDSIIQAEGGIMSVTGPADGPPMKVGVAIVDLTAGMFAAVAILAAVHERTQSGRGQYIDMALLDAQVAWLANVGSNFLVSGERPGRFGNAHPNIVPYETFATSDGWIAVGVGNDRQWVRLCTLAAWDDLKKDDRFATNPLRVEHRDALIPILRARFTARSSEEWYTALTDAGIPCGPIRSIDQVFADPQVLSRGMLLQLPHPTAGSVQLAGSPFKLSRTPVRFDAPPPLLGEHTDEILTQHLGYTSADIERLRNAGVI
jgi:formyl-CoA transferase